MKLVEYVNLTIRELVKEKENIVLYGQNINAGSCLSGLTRRFAENTRWSGTIVDYRGATLGPHRAM